MSGLPPDALAIIELFAPLFSESVWRWARTLLIGAILTPGRRTVTAALRVMELSEEKRFKNYHRVLSRARWSGSASSRVLLGMLIGLFAPSGPAVGTWGRLRKKARRLRTLEQVAADPRTDWQTLTVALWYGQRDRVIEITSGAAVWFHSGKPRWVLIRDPQGQFATQALLLTDTQAGAGDNNQVYSLAFRVVRRALGFARAASEDCWPSICSRLNPKTCGVEDARCIY